MPNRDAQSLLRHRWIGVVKARKPAFAGFRWDGSDGARTRDLRRDSQHLSAFLAAWRCRSGDPFVVQMCCTTNPSGGYAARKTASMQVIR